MRYGHSLALHKVGSVLQTHLPADFRFFFPYAHPFPYISPSKACPWISCSVCLCSSDSLDWCPRKTVVPLLVFSFFALFSEMFLLTEVSESIISVLLSVLARSAWWQRVCWSSAGSSIAFCVDHRNIFYELHSPRTGDFRAFWSLLWFCSRTRSLFFQHLKWQVTVPYLISHLAVHAGPVRAGWQSFWKGNEIILCWPLVLEC